MNPIDILLDEYNVTSEDELNQKLYDDALTIPCANCREEQNIDELDFIDGDPYCKKCH